MNQVEVIRMNKQDYAGCYQAMREYSLNRDSDSADQLWLLEHSPVYTLGLNGKNEHVLDSGNIPIIQTDRGGQVTYHGPGQLVVYCLFDLKRYDLMVKSLVYKLEQAVIDLLQDEYELQADRQAGAPGVYINGEKISAIGIRIKKGCSYHGLAINVDMDMQPFKGINPCGYRDLQVVQLSDFGIKENTDTVAKKIVPKIASQFEFTVATDFNLSTAPNISNSYVA